MAALDDFLSFLQGASNSAASVVSAPVDGINWALGKVGVPVSKKPAGGSEWLKELGFTAEPKNKTAGLLGEAVGGVLPIVAQAKAPQIAAGINQMISNAQAPRTLNPQTGAIVWHGSPHKFDRFDSSKIGTGEGAQAYGHGLYLAESPEVAGSYQKTLANGKVTGFDSKRYGGPSDDAKRLLMMQKDSPRQFAEVAADRGSYLGKIAADIKSGKIAWDEGALYKVDLPDEAIAKMLDWDKPLSQQPTGKQLLQVAENPDLKWAMSWANPYYGNTDAFTASRLVSSLEGKIGPKATSEAFKQAGIPGIRYLDGGSRGVGQGTSNFVIFPGNEGLLTILERNGHPLR